MTEAAEETRRHLLRRKAQQATQRVERLFAYLEDIYDNGGEPSAALVREFEAACRNAERAWLEAGIANTLPEEPAAERS